MFKEVTSLSFTFPSSSFYLFNRKANLLFKYMYMYSEQTSQAVTTAVASKVKSETFKILKLMSIGSCLEYYIKKSVCEGQVGSLQRVDPLYTYIVTS